MNVLAFNAGGTSHIAELYAVEDTPPHDPPAPLWRAEIDGKETTFERLLRDLPDEPVDAVGHRVVHPGLHRGHAPVARVDDELIRDVGDAIQLAPGHNRTGLEGMTAARSRFGDNVPQVAVFDTTLREDSPEVARLVPVPRLWRERYGLRRFGFHGISHHDACERVRHLLGKTGDAARVVTAHVGSGVSLAAFRGARVLDTTMSFTPMDGTIMAERAGSVDPGAIFHLLRSGLEPDEIERGLNRDSGLAGVSEVSYDTRDVLPAVERGDARARLAWDAYAYRLRWHVGALASVLGGIDALAFTGPVGEHVAAVRASVTDGLDYLGIALDEARNRGVPGGCDADISAPHARAATYVIRTLEEWAIAKRTRAFLASQ